MTIISQLEKFTRLVNCLFFPFKMSWSQLIFLFVLEFLMFLFLFWMLFSLLLQRREEEIILARPCRYISLLGLSPNIFVLGWMHLGSDFIFAVLVGCSTHYWCHPRMDRACRTNTSWWKRRPSWCLCHWVGWNYWYIDIF